MKRKQNYDIKIHQARAEFTRTLPNKKAELSLRTDTDRRGVRKGTNRVNRFCKAKLLYESQGGHACKDREG